MFNSTSNGRHQASVGAEGDEGRLVADDKSLELPPQATRRRFTDQYKRQILAQVDTCQSAAEVGALLRREGLYSGYLSKWRRQLADDAPGARKRGRKPADPRIAENEKLLRRAHRAEAELAKAKQVIEVQGKLSALLEQTLSQDAQTEGEH